MNTTPRRLPFHPLALVATALLAGCPDREITEQPPRPSRQTSTVVEIDQDRDIDILFVIDNSNSMADEQQQLTANFPKFMEVLGGVEGGLPNVHIGVVSSNVGAGGYAWNSSCAGTGDHGLLQATARGACSPPSGRFIEDVLLDDGTRQRNYPFASQTLERTFECIASLGTGGCGFEHHMESMRQALDGTNPENTGFLRPEALLAVVFIADEDDCSAADGAMFDDTAALDNATSKLGPRGLRCTEWAVDCDGANLPREAASYADCRPRADSPYFTHPKEYADFLRSLKPDHPERIILAGIVGPTTPFAITDNHTNDPNKLHLGASCGDDSTTGGDGAVPAIRFRALFDEFEGSVTARICDASLSPALATIASQIALQLPSPCLPADVDMTDLYVDRPGLQPECVVAQTLANGEDHAVPRCKMRDQDGLSEVDPAASAALCWYIGQDDEACRAPAYSGYTLKIHRTEALPDGARVDVNCVGI